jgi:flavorubredoxin
MPFFPVRMWGTARMREWQEECENLGIQMVADGLICHLMPDKEGLAACRQLGQLLDSE